jgi:cation transport regulator ChaC
VPYVFGYGSLARAAGAALPCRLLDHRRGWGVAMDNRLMIPGYKVYVDPLTGEQPPVYVAFLDIRPQPGARVNGVAFPVDADELALIDGRERQYERRDVTHLVDLDLDGRSRALRASAGFPDGTVWAYAGRAESRRRCAAGRADGTTVIAAPYHRHVREGFRARGLLDAFERTTDPPDLPERELQRVDLP